MELSFFDTTFFDTSGSFALGTPPSTPRLRSPRRSQRAILLNTPPLLFAFQKPWEERILTRPEFGKIRLLTKPAELSFDIKKYWYADLSLTEWVAIIEGLHTDMETNHLFRAVSDPDIVAIVTDVFLKNQRARWLAQWTLQRWKLRVWRKRTQCNVDMIDMAPIHDRDAILVTDTIQRQIFRFHRRDVYSSLIANICMSDEMMPYPRVPTNPWSNVPLTYAQTISVCAQLCMDYAKRGACPPVLLAAFCAARFNIHKFKDDNSSMLAQHAIYSYFKDLTAENLGTIYDTITQLLTVSSLRYSPAAISRWLKQIPQTTLHREWLLLVRDYTLYINLHVQVRPTWYSTAEIYTDVRALYRRTTADLPAQPRIRLLHTPAGIAATAGAESLNTVLQGLLGLQQGPSQLQLEPIDDASLLLLQSMIFHT